MKGKKWSDGTYPIDFVVTWVDGDNEEWLAEMEKYGRKTAKHVDARNRRYRNWHTFQYWFRGVEEYAPWVRKIYVVTPGYYPEWLRLDHPKIVPVDQNMLLPEDCRPTFSSCSTELCLHRIPGLSEHFVYFNDDMFLINKTKPADFFRDGLPLDSVAVSAESISTHHDGHTFYGIPMKNLELVAKHFTKKEVLRGNWYKFMDPRNGIRNLTKTMLTMPYRNFTGFNEPHTAYSYLKSTWDEIWNAEFDEVDETLHSRFRSDYGLSQWCCRYWQICSGTFKVRRSSFSRCIGIEDKDKMEKGVDALLHGRAKVLCLNDEFEDKEFNECIGRIQSAFQEKFPRKSSFEREFLPEEAE